MNQTIANTGFNDYMAPLYHYFYRSESRALAQRYVLGLMMAGARKTVESMAKQINASERGMQRLLTKVRWDEQGVIGEYRKGMLAETADPQGALVIGDTIFPKRGFHSVCVARQNCGPTGKALNCQIGVGVNYVGQGVAWPYALDLFVPRNWDLYDDADCQVKRRKTHMPDKAKHREKWKMALDLVDLAKSEGVAHRVITADAVYGNNPYFRRGLAQRRENYILEADGNLQVFLESMVSEELYENKDRSGGKSKSFLGVDAPCSPFKISDIGKMVPHERWERMSFKRPGDESAIDVETISVGVRPVVMGGNAGHTGECIWLVIAKFGHARTGAHRRYFFTNIPQHAPAFEMMRIYHDLFRNRHICRRMTREFGLDHYEGRSWVGWHRHICLVFLAFGFSSLRYFRKKKRQDALKWAGMMHN